MISPYAKINKLSFGLTNSSQLRKNITFFPVSDHLVQTKQQAIPHYPKDFYHRLKDFFFCSRYAHSLTCLVSELELNSVYTCAHFK